MTIKLIKFQGDSARCPKCNSEDIDIKYIGEGSATELIQINNQYHSLMDMPEFMFRTCNKCGYEWAEEVYS